MTDQDGYRIEAALQFGFVERSAHEGDEGVYLCTEAQLIAFAKVCERAGLYQAFTIPVSEIAERIAAVDAELAPIRDAEEARFMTAQGYVRGTDDEPGKRWVKRSEKRTQISDCDVCGGDCAAANPPVVNCPNGF